MLGRTLTKEEEMCDYLVSMAKKFNLRCGERDNGGHLYAGYGFVNESSLVSAINSAFQSFSGTPMYGDDFMRAAVIMKNIAMAHAFRDGNKRTSLAVAVFYLEMIGYRLAPKSTDEAVSSVLDIVSHKISTEEFCGKLKSWCKN